jgi:hypothetical protein
MTRDDSSSISPSSPESGAQVSVLQPSPNLRTFSKSRVLHRQPNQMVGFISTHDDKIAHFIFRLFVYVKVNQIYLSLVLDGVLK